MSKFNFNKEKLNKKINNMQKHLVEIVYRDSKPYVPKYSGALERSGRIINDHQIRWDKPYARFLWYGKLMLSPSGSSWAKRGEKKHVVNKDLNYNRSQNSRAGKQWVWRAKQDNIDRWIEELLRESKNI